MRKAVVACLMIGLVLCLSPSFSTAQEPEVIKLPPPQKEGGMPLMKALSLRKSTRGDFGPDTPLSMQTISSLLWAADGINRPGTNHRTAPSAVDWQNIDIYLTTADGLFLYDAQKHELKVLGKEDVRAVAGQQDFVPGAPLNLIYVADFDKAKFGDQVAPTAETWSFAGVGFIAQNVYLFCASENLACIVRAMADGDAIAKALKLRPNQKFILAQTVARFKE
ncbi:MAG: SagB/ThcOx family dehydrogenase [Acidobacteria bacterium]|nr:SagB/ThcOx family dehydrogenase [Acidobacteriota bacterium]